MKELDADIILRYLDGTLTEDEAREVSAWMKESQENRDYLVSLKETYMSSRYPYSVKKAKTESQWKELRSRLSIPSSRNAIPWHKIMVAAGAALLICALSFLAGRKASLPFGNDPITISTGIGERASATLPDGSSLMLNSCSSVSYAPHKAIKKNRTVSLQGEASFDVFHDSKRPFYVDCDGFKVKVLGTKFNIRSYEDASKKYISLKEGSVKIDLDGGGGSYLLTPGQTLSYDPTSGKCEILDSEDSLFGWEKGQIIFDNESIADKALELKRKYGYSFKIARGCENLRYRAKFKDESLSEIMGIFTKVSPELSFEMDPEQRIVTIRKKSSR